MTMLMFMAMILSLSGADGSTLNGAARHAERKLGSVHYLKPVENSAGLASNLAPLLFLEDTLERTNFAVYPDRPGSLASGSSRRLDMSRTTVYYSTSTLSAGGLAFAQLTYEWWYPFMDKKGKPLTRLKWQGIRMTLNSHGHPVIWEVLNESQHRQVIFVARSLEEKAKSQFTNACPSRQFVVEQPTEITPRTVVARIVEDGPVPMGPAAYVEQGTRDIAAILCRCMPPESTNVLTTSSYTLAPRPDKEAKKHGGIAKAMPLSSALRVLPD